MWFRLPVPNPNPNLNPNPKTDPDPNRKSNNNPGMWVSRPGLGLETDQQSAIFGYNIPRSLIESTFCIVCLLSLFLMQYDVSRLTLEVNDITLHLLTFNGSNHSLYSTILFYVRLFRYLLTEYL